MKVHNWHGNVPYCLSAKMASRFKNNVKIRVLEEAAENLNIRKSTMFHSNKDSNKCFVETTSLENCVLMYKFMP